MAAGREAMASECQWCLYVALLAITPVAMWCKKAFNEFVSVSSGQILVQNFEVEREGMNITNHPNVTVGTVEDFETVESFEAVRTDENGGWRVMEV